MLTLRVSVHEEGDEDEDEESAGLDMSLFLLNLRVTSRHTCTTVLIRNIQPGQTSFS